MPIIPHHLSLKTEGAYRQRLGLLVSKYERVVEPDGGFGLTVSQRASLVNTAEVLVVLRAAQRHEVKVNRRVVAEALSFISNNLARHCQPRTADAGRGEKTRFVTFSLLGLASWPEAIDGRKLETIDWGLVWLEQNRLADGLPEEAGVQDVSLFQGSVATIAASRLLPHLDGSVGQRAEELIDHCVSGLAYHASPDGFWPRQSYGSGLSPAKTALAILALQAMGDLDRTSDVLRVGGAFGPARVLTVEELVQSASIRLLSAVQRWRRFVEADPDVPGTQWSHLSYALCLQALSVSGAGLDHRALPAWADLLRLWDVNRPGWCEPTEPPSPSVRADYSTIGALEALLRDRGANGIAELDRLVAATPTEIPAIELVLVRPGSYAIRWTDRPHDLVHLPLSERQAQLLAIIDQVGEHGSAFVPTVLIAERLNVSVASIGQLVRRVNDVVASARREERRLIVSQRGAGYGLDVHAVRSLG